MLREAATRGRSPGSRRSAATSASAIANMVVVFSPDRVVIGGGISVAFDLFIEPIREELRRRVQTTSLDEVEVVPAELGTWAGFDRRGDPRRRGGGCRDATDRAFARSLRAPRMSTNATVVSGRLVLDDRVEDGRVTVADGWITAVEPGAASASDGAAGPYLAPGFVDVHVHGGGGHDAMGGRAALDGMARHLLRHGVTSFLPTGGVRTARRPVPLRRRRP